MCLISFHSIFLHLNFIILFYFISFSFLFLSFYFILFFIFKFYFFFFSFSFTVPYFISFYSNFFKLKFYCFILFWVIPASRPPRLKAHPTFPLLSETVARWVLPRFTPFLATAVKRIAALVQLATWQLSKSGFPADFACGEVAKGDERGGGRIFNRSAKFSFWKRLLRIHHGGTLSRGWHPKRVFYSIF